MASRYPHHWFTSCIPLMCPLWWGKAGCHLTTLFGYTATVMPVAVPKKKRTLLPLLVVLFIFSYALMTLLIIEQGAAIQSQGNLIKILMPESHQFWALKGKAVGDKQAQAQAQNHGQTPSSQAQATQTPATPTQATPQHPGRAGKAVKPQLPPVPASDLGDQRRT